MGYGLPPGELDLCQNFCSKTAFLKLGQLLRQVWLLTDNLPKTSGLERGVLVGHQGARRSPNMIFI